MVYGVLIADYSGCFAHIFAGIPAFHQTGINPIFGPFDSVQEAEKFIKVKQERFNFILNKKTKDLVESNSNEKSYYVTLNGERVIQLEIMEYDKDIPPMVSPYF